MPEKSLEQRTMRKVLWRILPLVLIGYFISIADRANLGIAAIQMNHDLKFGSELYGLGAGIFFTSYAVFEIPSNLLLERFGARVWIARIMITWGILAMLMAAVVGPKSFLTIRFLLGMAEAGYFPGVMLYFTYWLPKNYRARATAAMFLAFTLATSITPVISGALLELNDVLDMHGWQWLFILEGSPAILLALPILLVLPDRPANTKWLAQDEIAWLEEAVGGNGKAAPRSRELWVHRVPMDLKFLALSFMWFGVIGTGYGITFYLPLIVRSLTHLTPFKTGLLSALPPTAAMFGLVVFGYTSDRFAERRWHYVLSLLVAAAGYVAATRVSGASATIAALSIAAVGLYSCRPAFWALAVENMSANTAAVGLALVSALGSVGGFVFPLLIGKIKATTGSFDDALYLLAGFTAAAAVVGLLTTRHNSRREQPVVKVRLDHPML
jgi:ACS family tartrate transporter-like MFS transporter